MSSPDLSHLEFPGTYAPQCVHNPGGSCLVQHFRENVWFQRLSLNHPQSRWCLHLRGAGSLPLQPGGGVVLVGTVLQVAISQAVLNEANAVGGSHLAEQTQ